MYTKTFISNITLNNNNIKLNNNILNAKTKYMILYNFIYIIL